MNPASNIKINHNENFLPISLTNLVIKQTDLTPISIEEENSELFYKTLHGYGNITYVNNTEYSGFTKYGILESQYCKFKFHNGTIYEGNVTNNQLTGQGKFIFPSEAEYTGDVKNGLRDGEGTYEYKHQGIKYVGSWKNGLKHGFGKLTLKDQMVYEGQFINGIRQGHGKITWNSNNFFEGEFKDNKIQGNGYMLWNDLNEKYIGEWSENLQNGKGIHVWYESKGEQKYLRNRYVGEFRDGLRSGYGVFFYANGARYEGLWLNNVKHGYGVFTYHDGTVEASRYYNDRIEKFVEPSDDPSRRNSTKQDIFGGSKSGFNKRGKRTEKPKNNNLDDVAEIPETEEDNTNSKARDKNSNFNVNTNNQHISTQQVNANQNANNTNNSKQENDSKNKITEKKNGQDQPEINPFKFLIDVSDLIELEPEIETNFKEFENLMLRNLSEMKFWYKYYMSRELNTSDFGETITYNNNATIAKPSTSGKTPEIGFNTVQNDNQESLIDNNDFGFVMELKDLWKLIRESNLLSVEFTLANFNRFFYKNKKNYTEMFYYPDEIRIYSYEFFENIYIQIKKAKDDFLYKYKEKVISSPGFLQNQEDYVFKQSDSDSKLDVHNKKNIVLLRQFYEAIVRIAFLKYYKTPEIFVKKVKNLIDFIKLNPNLKKASRKKSLLHNTYNTDSSLNSTLILDLKVKVFESMFDSFVKNYEKSLKTIFETLFKKSENGFKNNDMTVTNRNIFKNLIQQSELVSKVIDKYKFTEFLVIYHKDKITITEENKYSFEVQKYIESLLENEAIFIEFAETLFFCCRKYLIDKNVSEKVENFAAIINHFCYLAEKLESKIPEKFYFPKLRNHKILDNMIENERQRKLQEERKLLEIKRVEYERNMIVLDDVNVLLGEEPGEDSHSEDLDASDQRN